MRRRRLPSRRSSRSSALVRHQATTDFRYLEQVVSIRFPLRSAQIYLSRHIGNPIRVRLVEVQRGETPGHVRQVEVRHGETGQKTWVLGERVLANGRPASFYVPDHLVRVLPVISGAAERSRNIGMNDEVVLYVPVRGYLRFLPAIFQGEGPVEAKQVTQVRSTALQRYQGRDLAEVQAAKMELDEEPLRRLLFLFQHMMNTVTDAIDRLDELTDPLLCDPKFLPWLASWVGFQLDESLPIHQQRELVRRAIRLMRTRGTRIGMEEMVRVLTSAGVRIEERVVPPAMVLGKNTIVGGQDVVERFRRKEPLGSHLLDPAARAPTRYFNLRLEARDRFAQRFGERADQVLRRIVNVVSQERPAHVRFTISFDQ